MQPCSPSPRSPPHAHRGRSYTHAAICRNKFCTGKIDKRFPSVVSEVIIESHPKIQPDSKVYGDTFEAILAAILLACGEEAAGAFVREHVLPQVVADA